MISFKDIFAKIMMLVLALSLVLVIDTYFKPNQNTLQNYYPLDKSKTHNYNTYFIRYGPLDIEKNIQGMIELKKTKEIVISDNNATLLITQLSIINEGDHIAIVNGNAFLSEIDGYVLNIEVSEKIVIEVIEYQDIILKSVISLADFICLDLNNNFNIYMENKAIDLNLETWYFDSINLKYILEFSNLPRGTRYLQNEMLIISQEVTMKSVYSIPNFLLTNEVEPNKYELLIYNPTLKNNNVYTKIIEVKFIPEYEYAEIVSDNLKLHEQIIYNND